jgi:hypothetical protein
MKRPMYFGGGAPIALCIKKLITPEHYVHGSRSALHHPAFQVVHPYVRGYYSVCKVGSAFPRNGDFFGPSTATSRENSGTRVLQFEGAGEISFAGIKSPPSLTGSTRAPPKKTGHSEDREGMSAVHYGRYFFYC